MGIVNTYLEYAADPYPINRYIATYFSSSSSSFRQGSTWTQQTNSTRPQSTTSSSTSGSRSAGTWYTMSSNNSYTSSTTSQFNGNGNGSQTVTIVPTTRTKFSASEADFTYNTILLVDTIITHFFGSTTTTQTELSNENTITNTVVVEGFPYPISHTEEPREKVTKTLITKSQPYWLTVRRDTIIEGLNVSTTTTTSEHTFSGKSYDSSLTTTKTFKYIKYGDSGQETQNKLPHIVVGAVADVYSYQVFKPKASTFNVFSEMFESLDGSVNTVTIEYKTDFRDVSVYVNDTANADSTIVKYNRNPDHSTENNIVFLTNKVWDVTGSSYRPVNYLGFGIGSEEKTIFGRPGATKTVPITINDGIYFPDAQLKLVQSSTSYTYLQNNATKTTYFSEIYESTAGTNFFPYWTSTADTITLATRNLRTTTGSTQTGGTIAGQYTSTYSSTGITSAEAIVKECSYSFARTEQIDVFYAGGAINLPVQVWHKKYNQGYLGFAGSYDKTDLSTLKAFRSFKVVKKGQPFASNSPSFNIYDHTSLFALARKNGTVIFWPNIYQTYKDFTVVATSLTGKLKTSADLSVIYSTTTQATKGMLTTTQKSYSYTKLTKNRNNTNVNTGAETINVDYTQLTTTQTLVDSVTKTTVTYDFELDSSVDTTGYYSFYADTLGSPKGSPFTYYGPQLWIYGNLSSRGLLGEVGGYSDTTMMFQGNFSLKYTLIKSDGQTESATKVFTNITNTAEKFSTLSKNQRMYLELSRLYSTYPVTGNTQTPLNIPLARCVKIEQGFFFL